ncbi:hypothetical protein V2J09_019139 [Rumex salicifolius]
MEFPRLQSRVSSSASSSSSSSYVPLHKTQLHPRMQPFLLSTPNSKSISSSPNKNPHKLLLLFVSISLLPFLFYLVSLYRSIHLSTKFTPPASRAYGLILHVGASRSQIRVFQTLDQDSGTPVLGEGSDSLVIPNGLSGLSSDPAGAERLVLELVEFAKLKVPKSEWKNTVVQLMVSADEGGDEVLEECRRVLKESDFLFKDDKAGVLRGEDEGIYAWIALNYVLGTLGNEPHDTSGIVVLGGSFVQITYASREPEQVEFSRTIRLAGVTYRLYTQSLPQFSQKLKLDHVLKQETYLDHFDLDIVVMYKLHMLFMHDILTSIIKSERGWGIISYALMDCSRVFDFPHEQEASWKKLLGIQNSQADGERAASNPCIPKGYEIQANSSDGKVHQPPAIGNFSACRFEVSELLKRSKGECSSRACKDSLVDLRGHTGAERGFFYISKFLGPHPRSSLSELEAVGRHFCEDDWDAVKSEHPDVDDVDLSRYCFSHAYTVALLHDSLGIPFENKRVRLKSDDTSIPVDWTLGAFIHLMTAESLEKMRAEDEFQDQIVGNESVTCTAGCILCNEIEKTADEDNIRPGEGAVYNHPCTQMTIEIVESLRVMTRESRDHYI